MANRLAHQRVQQCRLSHVGAAEEGYFGHFGKLDGAEFGGAKEEGWRVGVKEAVGGMQLGGCGGLRVVVVGEEGRGYSCSFDGRCIVSWVGQYDCFARCGWCGQRRCWPVQGRSYIVDAEVMVLPIKGGKEKRLVN